MKTLVVYETFFGNTEQVARAIGAALPAQAGAEVVKVDEAIKGLPAGTDLLIVGSPTRAFRPTAGTMKYLNALPAGTLKGVNVAAFDTRMDVKEVDSKILTFMASIFGYAAKPIADRLVKKGGSLVLAPEGFIVKGSEGPMGDGELDRVAEWARKVYASAGKP
jgi:flavodoxin I